MESFLTIHKQISITAKRIKLFRHKAFLSKSQKKRSYFEKKIGVELYRLDSLLQQVESLLVDAGRELANSHQQEQEFTLEELATYDGAEGRPAYIAVSGTVYDVSINPTWGGGTHFGLYAGQDLTQQFEGCHPGQKAILNKLPVVGVLIDG